MALRAIAIVMLSLFASACALVPGAGGCGGAEFLVASPAGLQCLDHRGSVVARLVALPAQATPALATRQATTGRIFFTLLVIDTKTGFGTDLMSVAPDGSDIRVVLAHESDNVFYDTPSADRAGAFLYFHRAAKLTRNGAYVGTESTIERLELSSGRRTVIVRDAADPTISPDGNTIVYVRLVDGAAVELWAADATGTNARNLLRGHTFAHIQAPRFAPNDDRIAFSSAGHAAPISARLPHFAHLGIPSDLFVMRLDGTGLRSVGKNADDVIPGWSLDGASIAFISKGSLIVTDVASATPRTIASLPFPNGDVLWLR
jgi:Tol biopolymer transport system component